MTHSRPRLALLSCAFLLVAACGGGGAAPIVADAPPPPLLAITTASLPDGTPGVAYQAPPLAAANGQGPIVWDLAGGALPDGLGLDPAGTLTGTPSVEGLFSFVVRATDDITSDTRALDISIGTLDVFATAGLTLGDAWTARPVTISASGATATVSFSVVLNGSGGALSGANPVAGTVTWTPGSAAGAGTLDTIRATDDGSGAFADLDLSVMPNPVEDHVAAFGSTDVWWVSPDLKFGSHAFATDLHKALADTGLRAPSSTGATGTVADELALLYFRVELLRQVNPLFLRNADGSAGQGLSISFPFEEPGAGYTKPASGSSFSGSPVRYSQMALLEGGSGGVIGTAFIDGASNGSHENDTTAGSLELGVFVDQIVDFFNGAYQNNVLPSLPVGAADEAALRALLYGLPNPGGRYTLIKYVGEGLARTIAAVLAHEVGHSLGLGHTSPAQSGSIMNASASISPSASYHFTSEDVATLTGALPGSGKSTGGQAAQKVGVEGIPEGGVAVCHCRAHGSADTAPDAR